MRDEKSQESPFRWTLEETCVSGVPWPKTIPVVPNADSWGGDRNCYFVVDRAHTGLMDLFVTHFRKELEKTPKKKKPSVLDKLSKPLPEAAPMPTSIRLPSIRMRQGASTTRIWRKYSDTRKRFIRNKNELLTRLAKLQ